VGACSGCYMQHGLSVGKRVLFVACGVLKLSLKSHSHPAPTAADVRMAAAAALADGCDVHPGVAADALGRAIELYEKVGDSFAARAGAWTVMVWRWCRQQGCGCGWRPVVMWWCGNGGASSRAVAVDEMGSLFWLPSARLACVHHPFNHHLLFLFPFFLLQAPRWRCRRWPPTCPPTSCPPPSTSCSPAAWRTTTRTLGRA